MRLKLQPLEIDSANAFAGDKLDRHQFVEPLNALLKTAEDSLVLAVEAPWGWGKTTFLKMWIGELKRSNAPVIYFNAWENDFTGTPLVSLLAELNSGLKELLPDSKGMQAVETLKNAGAKFLKHAIPVALKLGTSGLIDLQGGTSDAVKDGFSSVSEGVASEFVNTYSVAKSSLADFKDKLAVVASELAVDKIDSFPLTIFIDELDRCRPDYALEMLEAVKHLFDVPGVNFVLAMNREQIEQSVEAVYGSRINASEYLRRFIDLSFYLPEPDTKAFVPFVLEQLGISEDLKQRSNDGGRFKGGQPSEIAEILVSLFTLFSLSLRTQEQVLSQLSLVLRMTPHSKEVFPDLLAIMLTLHALDRKLYRRFATGEAPGADVVEWIGSDPKRRSFLESGQGIRIEGWLLMTDGRRNSDPVATYRTIAESGDASNDEHDHAITLVKYCDWIKNEVLLGGDFRRVMEFLARRIDLLENIAPNLNQE